MKCFNFLLNFYFSVSLVKTPEPKVNVSTPVSRGERSESLDSLGGMSPSELTSILCRNIPPALNKRNVIEKHFARFGKVCKILCRPGKNLAIVHFNDHVSTIFFCTNQIKSPLFAMTLSVLLSMFIDVFDQFNIFIFLFTCLI